MVDALLSFIKRRTEVLMFEEKEFGSNIVVSTTKFFTFPFYLSHYLCKVLVDLDNLSLSYGFKRISKNLTLIDWYIDKKLIAVLLIKKSVQCRGRKSTSGMMSVDSI